MAKHPRLHYLWYQLFQSAVQFTNRSFCRVNTIPRRGLPSSLPSSSSSSFSPPFPQVVQFHLDFPSQDINNRHHSRQFGQVDRMASSSSSSSSAGRRCEQLLSGKAFYKSNILEIWRHQFAAREAFWRGVTERGPRLEQLGLVVGGTSITRVIYSFYYVSSKLN